MKKSRTLFAVYAKMLLIAAYRIHPSGNSPYALNLGLIVPVYAQFWFPFQCKNSGLNSVFYHEEPHWVWGYTRPHRGIFADTPVCSHIGDSFLGRLKNKWQVRQLHKSSLTYEDRFRSNQTEWHPSGRYSQQALRYKHLQHPLLSMIWRGNIWCPLVGGRNGRA
jgi:hypothetical protein